MSEDFIKKLEKISSAIKADEAWISRTRINLLAYMALHPKASKNKFSWKYFLHAFPAAVLTMVIFMASAGGITLASNSTIPGDFLYPWKVKVVESIESVFVVGTQNRATFEVSRTAKRLQEVTELAVREKVSDEIVAKAHSKLEEQVKTASDEIAKVALNDKEKAIEVAIQLDATLLAHKDVLNNLEGKVTTEVQASVLGAISTIEKTSNSASVALIEVRQTPELKADTISEESIAFKLESEKKKIESTWDRISKLNSYTDLRLEAERKLHIAQDAITAGEEDLSNEDFESALIDIESASKLTSETIALLDASSKTSLSLKQLLGTTSPSPEPSIIASEITDVKPTEISPLTTPDPSATPKPTLSVSPSPKPSPVLFSVELDKEIYAPYEIIIANVRAVNTSTLPVTLSWTNGCQVIVSINSPPSAKDRVCTMEAGTTIIEAQQTQSWKIQVVAPPVGSEHIIYAEIVGYDTAKAPFTVVIPVKENELQSEESQSLMLAL